MEYPTNKEEGARKPTNKEGTQADKVIEVVFTEPVPAPAPPPPKEE